MTQWYYTNGRSKHGPTDEAGIRARVEKGYVRPDTLLWHEGLSDWKTAAELGFFPDAPRPAAPASPPPKPAPAPVAASAAPAPAGASVASPAASFPPPPSAAPQPAINVSVNASSSGGGSEIPVSVGNWILTFIAMAIPLVNVILLLVWAFGGSTSKSKCNWARAALILALIGFLVWLLFFVLLASAFR